MILRETGKVFYDGLGYVFLELVNFALDEHQLATALDKWLYVLKNISRMDKLPALLRKPIFEKLFSIAEYSNMTREERDMYQESLRHKWDNEARLAYAHEEGLKKGLEAGEKKGLEKGRMEERAKAEAEKKALLLKAEAEKRMTEQTLHSMFMSAVQIAKAVGLSVEEVQQILAQP